MPLKKVHEVAFANSAKRQNALGATSRKQLTLKHLPILILNVSVESFSTPSFVSATISDKKCSIRRNRHRLMKSSDRKVTIRRLQLNVDRDPPDDRLAG